MTDDDTDPAEVAQLDQALAELTTRARLCGSYFHDLLNNGFTRPEALDLTLALQESLFDDDED